MAELRSSTYLNCKAIQLPYAVKILEAKLKATRGGAQPSRVRQTPTATIMERMTSSNTLNARMPIEPRKPAG